MFFCTQLLTSAIDFSIVQARMQFPTVPCVIFHLVPMVIEGGTGTAT